MRSLKKVPTPAYKLGLKEHYMMHAGEDGPGSDDLKLTKTEIAGGVAGGAAAFGVICLAVYFLYYY